MGTSITLVEEDNYRLYVEIFEPDRIMLTLVGADFCAERNRVTVEIPADVWEKIRAVGADDRRIVWVRGEDVDHVVL